MSLHGLLTLTALHFTLAFACMSHSTISVAFNLFRGGCSLGNLPRVFVHCDKFLHNA
jgi:hypothetical protein